MLRARIASTSAAVGSDGCAPKRDAARAPAAHARRSASSCARPSSSETSRHAVKASPGAVPSTASTGGGSRPRDLLAVLEQDGALGAEGQRDEPVPCGERLELVAVDDGEIRVDRDAAAPARR